MVGPPGKPEAISYFSPWLIRVQVDLTKDDSSSPDQLREAFRGMAGEKVGIHYICVLESAYVGLGLRDRPGLPVCESTQRDYQVFRRGHAGCNNC
jgi:hypothetical protein